MRKWDPSAFWGGITVDLTPEQRMAIAHVDGPLLVVAGPGSGKTTVITYRTAYLTQVAGVDPAALLVVTFTKAAADAMKARSAAVAGPMVAARATFGTFHALAYRILRQAEPGRRITIMEENDQLALLRQLMRRIGLNMDDDTVMNAVAEISRMRAQLAHQDFKPSGIGKADFTTLWQGYQEAKAQRGVIDFDDLLHEALASLRTQPALLGALRERYRYLMIDEVQDTNAIQWEIVRLIAEPLQNFCIVGDDDQAIYGWRGASPHFLLQFPQEYPSAVRVTLDLNHRCPPTVVAAANRLAAQNKARFGKVVRAAKPQGEPVQLLAPADSLQEAEEIVQLVKQAQVPYSDWAVIYRTNQQAHALAQMLDRASIPFVALGGLPNLYKRWPVQDVLCYLRAAIGEMAALDQVINRPNRYLSRTVLQEAGKLVARSKVDLLGAIAQTGLLRSWQLKPIEELTDHLRRVAPMTAPEAIGYVRRMIGYDEYILEYCSREGGSADEMLGLLTEVERTAPRILLAPFLVEVESFSRRGRSGSIEEEAVTLVTCHKAKGLEFPRVVVVGATDKLMPHRGSTDVEEERRLMYVAMTRAEERLWLSAPRGYEGRETQPSPFIGEALGPAAAALLTSAAVSGGGKVPMGPTPAPPDLPMEPGVPVYHERHGRGQIESVDPTLRRVIIDFGGKRLSLDLGWCQASPQFFRVLVGE